MKNRNRHEHQATRDGRVPTLLRLKPQTLRTIDELELDAPSRTEKVQLILDQWIDEHTEPA